MKIHEYQAKNLLKDFGVPISKGFAIQNLNELDGVYKNLGGGVVAVKAQIHAGGRGKGGGVKIAKSEADMKKFAGEILGMNLITHQTGAQGQKVRSLYIEAGTAIAKEMYLAVLLDRETSRLTLIAAAEGGMDIEELAAKSPEKILKFQIDPTLGFRAFQGRLLGYGLGIPDSTHTELIKLCQSLVRAYMELDASLVEINPLVLNSENRLIALDAKMTFDDNALYRHKNILELRDVNEEDALELEAAETGLNYISLDGTVGCMVNGAGLAMATMDVIKLAGAEPSNFLDVGGGANTEQVTKAFQIILKDKKVRAILVNIFGGIMKCDIIANGILEAAKITKLSLPLVVRLQGTNAKEGLAILAKSGLKIDTAETMAEAAEKVVKAAKG
ncbi:MAG: ADP-forming succinate--CoA ligase subunit beta [Deltaproteobacteria bacterium]|nr:ADP-forming succinate--CoA ligase subunit beta [Deltaproteobacteria bacterium]